MNRIFNKNFTIKLSDFAKYTPHSKSYKLKNFYGGIWNESKHYEKFPNPLTGEKDFLNVPLTQTNEEQTLITNEMKSVPKSGLHNPFKNTHRYVQYGEITRRISEALHKPEIFDHFVE